MPVSRLSRRFGWLVLALGMVLLPRASYASQQVYADFDGDGQRDHAIFDPAHSSMLRIWLSSNQSAGVLHSRFQLLRLTAIDVDGDGRPELVAADRRSRVLVWKAAGGHFKLYRHRRTTRPTLSHRGPLRTVGDDPSSADDSVPSRPYGDAADLDASAPDVSWVGNLASRVLPPRRRAPAGGAFDPVSPRAPPLSPF